MLMLMGCLPLPSQVIIGLFSEFRLMLAPTAFMGQLPGIAIISPLHLLNVPLRLMFSLS